MTKKRTNASTFVPFIERNWIGRGEFVEMFETESSTFGIALFDCGPFLQKCISGKLCLSNSAHSLVTLFGICRNFLSSGCSFDRIKAGAADAEMPPAEDRGRAKRGRFFARSAVGELIPPALVG
jgi:hypothetical protein